MAKKKITEISIQVELLQFREQGEKTGWTYFEIPADITEQLNPGVKKSYRVKGQMDAYEFSGVALIPMGDGSFIIPFNAAMRKATGKRKGDEVFVRLQLDTEEKELDDALIQCLQEDPASWERFSSLPKGHQRYYSNWIASAKTEATKADRLMKTLFAMQNQMDYGQMLRHFKAQKLK